ncbi:MAG TPA: hypothetical protein DCR97_11580 [Deltaproteobacteria bacterium]|nr:hypothetical protein [Deltaproteobacteria bacterium]
MKKACGYCRVSTEDQQKEGTSLESQRAVIEKECQHKGFELVEIYEDAVSGSSLNRPALNQLRRDAAAKRFDTVLYTKVDRLSRKAGDIYYLYDELLDKWKIDVICIDNPAATAIGPMGKAMLGIMAVFAELDRANIRERTAQGRRSRWAKGETAIGELPFGYRLEKIGGSKIGKIVVEPEQADLYHRIVSDYLEKRMTVTQIADQLSLEGIPTPSKWKGRKSRNKTGRWDHTTVSKMLKREAYTGQAVYAKSAYEWRDHPEKGRVVRKTTTEKPQAEHITLTLPPMISIDRWNAIQARLKDNTLKPVRKYPEHENHFLLRDLSYCGICGSKVNVSVHKVHGKTYLDYICYYRKCSTRELERSGREKKCELDYVPADEADRQFWNQITYLLTSPSDSLKAFLKNTNLDELKQKMTNLENSEKQLKSKLEIGFNYLSDITDNDERQIYLDQHSKTKELWAAVKSELAAVKVEHDAIVNKAQRLTDLEAMFKEKRIHFMHEIIARLDALPFSEKRKIVEAIVGHDKGGKVKIGYVTPNDFLTDEMMGGMTLDDIGKLTDDEANSLTDSDLFGLTEEERFEPLIDQARPIKTFKIEGDFVIDAAVIETIIKNLQGKIEGGGGSDDSSEGGSDDDSTMGNSVDRVTQRRVFSNPPAFH